MIKNLIRKIKTNLSPDLLKPQFKGSENPIAGHCYVASETLFHLLGGKEKGYVACTLKHEGVSHWWILGPSKEIYDITANQFKIPVPYEKGRKCGFLTKNPSKRAKILINRIEKNEN